MSSLKVLACAAVLVLPWAAHAQDDEREQPPAGGEPKDFSLPQQIEFELDNGLSVTLVPFGDVPKATVAAFVRSGHLNDGERTWLSNLSADFLLEGTATRSREAIAEGTAAMGGGISVGVGDDQTQIGTDVLSEFTPSMIELVADVIRNPAFPEAELERLKRDRLRQISVAKSNPQTMAVADFRRALYADHPYGRLLPDEAEFEALTIEDARNFHRDNFGAQRTALYVAGVFDESGVREAIVRAFGDWEEGPAPLIDVPMPAEGRVELDIVNRPGASQSNVMLGLPTINPSDDDWIALQITNALLGGSFSSRITSNIREDKGYTYSPNSSIQTRYRDAYWVQSAAVTTDVTGPAIKEILYEIDRLQETPPPEEELTGIKNYAAGAFVLQNSSLGGIVAMLNYLALHDLPDTYLTDYVSDVYAVTPEKISEMASKYLREEDMTLVIVGDRAQISEQVEGYRTGER